MAEEFTAREADTSVMHGIVPRSLPPEQRAIASRGRIAIADPSHRVRRTIADILASDGYDVREISEAAELGRFDGWEPDLVIVTPSTFALECDASIVFSTEMDLDDLRTAILNLVG